MQIRRVLLLFALVLGLSAVVASIAPPPEETQEAKTTETTATSASRVRRMPAVTLPARVAVGSSFSLKVPVPEPGDVVVQALGLRQTADPRSPARFYLLASPAGRYEVTFEPVLGGRKVIGRLAFVEPATVTPRRPAR